MANIDRLKELIEIELEECDKYLMPHVCSMGGDPETRQELTDLIIKQVKGSGVTVGQAMQRIERAYNPNIIED